MAATQLPAKSRRLYGKIRWRAFKKENSQKTSPQCFGVLHFATSLVIRFSTGGLMTDVAKLAHWPAYFAEIDSAGG